ncbi:hypothetical protein PENSPDRAFT_755291 [Peniophora sp. CONT]|nr:hypothetical protein PENSPDRAFT_755291 [Peniophora sp. CONT]
MTSLSRAAASRDAGNDASPSNTFQLRLMGVDLVHMSFSADGLIRAMRHILSPAERSSLGRSVTTAIRMANTEETGVVVASSSVDTGSGLTNLLTDLLGSFTRLFTWPFMQEVPHVLDVNIAYITLIDALGRPLRLEVGMSLNDVHTRVIDRFRDGEGWRYVQANDYNLLLQSAGQPSIINPDVWATVQADMTIEMSVIIHQVSPVVQCPYCQTVTSEAAENTRIRCAGCARLYLASVASVSTSRIEEVDLSSPDLDRSQPPTAAHDNSSQSTIPVKSTPSSPPSVLLDDPSVSSSTARNTGLSGSLTEDDHHSTPRQPTDMPARRHTNDAVSFKLVTVARTDLAVGTGAVIDGFAASLHWESLSDPLLSASDDLPHVNNLISEARRAADLTPDGHPNQAIHYNDLGHLLLVRYARNGNLDDIQQSIAAVRRTVEFTPDDHPAKPSCYNNLGLLLHVRFKRNSHLDDIEQSVAAHRRAVELTPDGHPAKLIRYSNLGESLAVRCNHKPTLFNFEMAVQAYMEAIAQPLGSSSLRLTTALHCVQLHSSHPFLSSTEPLLLAHSYIFAILPEVVWLGHDIRHRFSVSAKPGEFLSAAVSAAIAAGFLEQPIEWLEAGRALIWSQVLWLRTPLDELREAHPDLAESLQKVQQQLQPTAPISFAANAYREGPGMTVNVGEDHYRRLSIQYDELFKKIRECEGFEDFLRPQRLFSLIPSSTEFADGPVVVLNVDATQCDALGILPGGGITLIPLPELSLERALQLGSFWTRQLKGHPIYEREPATQEASEVHPDTQVNLAVNPKSHPLLHLSPLRSDDPLEYLLALIWDWIVSPVLNALNISSPSSGDYLPHITWCPTGPLMQLPLHLAGLYSAPDGPRAFDFVVSSYTPSLSAFWRSHEAAMKPKPVPNALIVTQPASPSPGHLPIPRTTAEGTCVANILRDSQLASTLLNHEQATVSSVRGIISQFPWVHLACHGSQHPGDSATQSAFALYDGPLSLADLMRTASDDAELRFPFSSAHLAAGMLAVGFQGVVANTMWSIMDDDAPIIVKAYYKELLQLRKSGAVRKGQTGAAYALHEAVAQMRARVGEENFGRWAPFLHFGV